ncbi:MAG: hypothetical protein UW03_C0030G0006 [Candidatus Peregrinibacteria bacterium GW2011_GWA2_43_8]|nr:MAG: hypothetical protein UW03_C0030G0006 [Candidatus Peregrinibacteria bacterium GW2011_GWA2_43_8]
MKGYEGSFFNFQFMNPKDRELQCLERIAPRDEIERNRWVQRASDVARDIRTISETMAENRSSYALEPVAPGPYEVNVGIDESVLEHVVSRIEGSVVDGVRDSVDYLDSSVDRVYDEQVRTNGLVRFFHADVSSSLEGIRGNIELLTGVSGLNLGIAAVGVGVYFEQLEEQKKIRDTLAVMHDDLTDGLVGIAVGIEDATEAIIEAQNKGFLFLGDAISDGFVELHIEQERRHREMVAVVREVAENSHEYRAREKFRHAEINFRTKKYGAALNDLKDVFCEVSVFSPGWLLFARISFILGQVTVAKEACRFARSYSSERGEKDVYMNATIELIRLELATGNFDSMRDMVKDVPIAELLMDPVIREFFSQRLVEICRVFRSVEVDDINIDAPQYLNKWSKFTEFKDLLKKLEACLIFFCHDVQSEFFDDDKTFKVVCKIFNEIMKIFACSPDILLQKMKESPRAYDYLSRIVDGYSRPQLTGRGVMKRFKGLKELVGELERALMPI